MTIENVVYQAVIGELETLGREGRLIGNTHHIAQRLSARVAEACRIREIGDIKDAVFIIGGYFDGDDMTVEAGVWLAERETERPKKEHG